MTLKTNEIIFNFNLILILLSNATPLPPPPPPPLSFIVCFCANTTSSFSAANQGVNLGPITKSLWVCVCVLPPLPVFVRGHWFLMAVFRPCVLDPICPPRWLHCVSRKDAGVQHENTWCNCLHFKLVGISGVSSLFGGETELRFSVVLLVLRIGGLLMCWSVPSGSSNLWLHSQLFSQVILSVVCLVKCQRIF